MTASVFTYRQPRWIAYLLFAVLGIVGAGLALGALALFWEGELSARSVGLSGVALFFIAGGWLAKIYMTDPRYALPALVFFDDPNREFVVEEADGRRGAIPYVALRGVEVRKVRRSSGKSSSTSWVVFLQRNDGGTWDLKACRNEAEARGLARELSSLISGNTGTEAGTNIFPTIAGVAGVTMERSGDTTSFTWSPGGGLKYSLVSLAVLLGFSVMLGAFVRVEWSSSPVFAVVIAAVALLLGLAPIYQMVQLLHTVRRVRVGNGALTYAVGSRRGDAWVEKKSIPLGLVSRVRFCYDLFTSNPVHGYDLLLLDEAMAERLMALASPPENVGDVFACVMEAIQLERQVFRLRFPGLKTVDILRLESLLEEALRLCGGKVE